MKSFVALASGLREVLGLYPVRAVAILEQEGGLYMMTAGPFSVGPLPLEGCIIELYDKFLALTPDEPRKCA